MCLGVLLYERTGPVELIPIPFTPLLPSTSTTTTTQVVLVLVLIFLSLS